MFGVLRSVALFLVFVSSTSTRVDRLSEKYTVNIFAEIQWEPFSAPIFTVNPMIDDVISIPLFWFFIFSNSLCVWWMSCFLEVESVLLFGGRLDITTRSALYLSLCDAFTLKESQLLMRRWWLSGNDSLLIWWSESGGSSESEYQWWFAFWFGFDWNKVFLFGILWTGCFILEQKLKIFRKSPLCIHSSVWMKKEKEKREREKMIVIFNLNDVPLLPLLFEMMSVVCVNPFPSLLVCKIEDCVPLCIAIQEVTRFSSVPLPFFCSALCESCFLLNLLFTSAMSPQWSWDFKLY